MRMDHLTSIVLLTGAGASKPLGLPVMKEFLPEDFWHMGDTWRQAVAYLAYQWARANTGIHDFEYIYTLAHVLSDVTIDDPLAFGMTRQAPTIVNLPGGSNLQLNVDAVRSGARDLREGLRVHVHTQLADFDKAAQIYGKFLSPLLERLGSSATVPIFTTNYDRIVESIWQWGKHTNAFAQPTVFRRGFVTKDAYQPGFVWDPSDYDKPAPEGDATIKLYKLHGSLHWRVFAGGVVETEANEYAADRSIVIYPLRGTKLHLSEPFTTLFRFWRASVSTCTDCLIVGSSLRDPQIVEPMVQAVNQSSRLRLWIIDPDADRVLGQLPEDVRMRVVAVTAGFDNPDLGRTLADYIFEPAKRETARRIIL